MNSLNNLIPSSTNITFHIEGLSDQFILPEADKHNPKKVKEWHEKHKVVIRKVSPKRIKKELGHILNNLDELFFDDNYKKSAEKLIRLCLSSRDLWKKPMYETYDGSYIPCRILINNTGNSWIGINCIDKNCIKPYYTHDNEYFVEKGAFKKMVDSDIPRMDAKKKFKYLLSKFDYVIFQICVHKYTYDEYKFMTTYLIG